VTTVDIEPRTLQISRQFFGFHGHEKWEGVGKQSVVIADAARHMRRAGRLYDFVAVDCFDSDTIPDACQSEAFYTAVKGVLAPKATFMQNVLGASGSKLQELKATAEAAAGVRLEEPGHPQWLEGHPGA
jgi:spermidine synthase